MPFYQLHIDLEFDGLTSVGFAPSTQPTIKCEIECSNCREVNKNAFLCLEDAYYCDDTKATLHWAAACKGCKATHKLWVANIPTLIKDGTIKVTKLTPALPYLNDNYCKIGTNTKNTLFTVVESRGAEITNFEILNTTFHAANDKNETFEVGDLSTDGYYDVDTDNESISVTLLGFRVAKC